VIPAGILPDCRINQTKRIGIAQQDQKGDQEAANDHDQDLSCQVAFTVSKQSKSTDRLIFHPGHACTLLV